MYYFYNPSQNRIEKRPVPAAFLTKTYKKGWLRTGLIWNWKMPIILSLFIKKERKNWDHPVGVALTTFRKPDSLDFPSHQRLVVHKRGHFWRVHNYEADSAQLMYNRMEERGATNRWCRKKQNTNPPCEELLKKNEHFGWYWMHHGCQKKENLICVHVNLRKPSWQNSELKVSDFHKAKTHTHLSVKNTINQYFASK